MPPILKPPPFRPITTAIHHQSTTHHKSIPILSPLRPVVHTTHSRPHATKTKPITCPPRSASSSSSSSPAPTTSSHATDRGPPSTEKTQSDFDVLDVLGSTPVPSTAIDACFDDGFHLNSTVKIRGGKGVLLVGGEAFTWCPWLTTTGGGGGGGGVKLLDERGRWRVGEESWGILGLVWPKPDLLILGLGPGMLPINPETKAYVHSLGIRIDIQDTRNACAQFNLLATERGVGNVAAALIPIGFREGIGIRSTGL